MEWQDIKTVPTGCYVLLWEKTEWNSRPHIHWFTTDGEAKTPEIADTTSLQEVYQSGVNDCIKWHNQQADECEKNGEYKMNNNAVSEMARRFMADYPEYAGIFVTRGKHNAL